MTEAEQFNPAVAVERGLIFRPAVGWRGLSQALHFGETMRAFDEIAIGDGFKFIILFLKKMKVFP